VNIQTNVPLAKYSTMRLGGNAKFFCQITDKLDIPNALDWAFQKKLPVIMIGGGSNIIWSDDGFAGLVMINGIKGLEIIKESDDFSYVTVGAGENWDKTVEKTVSLGLSGIEALSLIPGTSGGTPIQNVGAYGQEIADTLISCDAYDIKTKTFVTIPNEYCDFGYRTSRFKTNDKGRFFICSLRFRLSAKPPEPPFYPALQSYFDEYNIHTYSAVAVRSAVIAIRKSKLPDPKEHANNGSFFANPIVTKTKYEKLQTRYKSIPGWPTKDNRIKISAAWLVENAGYKNFYDRKTGMATWKKQPLVLVNESAKHTADLLIFRNRIINDVQHTFDITLEQEPEIISPHTT
jgi:UDP-N-acetylmuramate dehydrogenase